MRRGGHFVVVALGLALASSGCDCGSGDVLLAVDLRTDFLAGTEVTLAETEVAEGATFEPGMPVMQLSAELAAGEDLLARKRIAELDLAPGTYAVRVRLFDGSGARRGERLMVVTLDGSTIATAVILRQCETVTCPEGQTCAAGSCVDPRCRPEEPETCIPPMCSTDAECTPPACFRTACIEGACASVPDEAACRDGGPMPDAAPGVDAGPIDCTIPSQCDDGNVCTEDDCVSGTCVYAPNDDGCDDAVFCNGFDRCRDSVCSVHDGDPCVPSMCDESRRACLGCPAMPCPGPSTGDWGPCDYSGICDETAVMRRTTRTFECTGGACIPNDTEETMGCTRETGSMVCRADPEPWSACIGESGVCDSMGTETRLVIYALCDGDVCPAFGGSVPEERPCTRVVPPGSPCPTGSCCDDSCVETANDRSNCGSCGIDCTDLVDTSFGMWRADTCSGGTCVCRDEGVPCPSHRICCPVAGSIRCYDPNTDRNHCGGCNRVCGAALSCVAGMCR